MTSGNSKNKIGPIAKIKHGKNPDAAETAAKIAETLLQLRDMAKTADMQFLVYFLEMAFQEAFAQSTKGDFESQAVEEL